ncbi:DUF2589 domain-containing protein [Streptomyces cinereoruber]|uniref:DUF2589 domain-containing protein n=1 Tax=Streptomyces cinereoruber TaxID=67260 RepID=UPI00160D3EDE|nr:DUF2589 domain-containing protein [Streptomyces cinereoruber]MBB4161600.1 hypothetical protein [Streptomyces cinereoruber]MBY8820617.1 DUF2589 domain-containing protein [Streptomyces cinereoruber]NIH65547.1 hypothetical protein [Streptomyces cinereoruber]
MAEAKKTSPARKTAAVKKTAAAKATAEKPAPGASGGADSAPFVADVPSVPGEDPKPPVDLGAELSLPFEQIIGGPLQGVIRASAMAANETAQFINNVGFDAKNQARMVKFSYESAEHGEADQTTTPEKRVVTNVEVPLLAVVPIPYLQLSQVTLDFDVKIDSASARKQESTLGGEAAVSGGFWGVTASVKASYSSSSSSSDTVNRSASMKVHVEAQQGPMPAGMEKILTMLTENAVTVQRENKKKEENNRS